MIKEDVKYVGTQKVSSGQKPVKDSSKEIQKGVQFSKIANSRKSILSLNNSKSTVEQSKNDIVQKQYQVGQKQNQVGQKQNQVGLKQIQVGQKQVNIGQKVQYIELSVQKTNEQETKLKQLNELLKRQAEKVELRLETKFESDNSLMNFSSELIKVANKINYLKWVIKGSFSDEGQAKCIGDTVGRFTAAYRIELHIIETQFGDRAAAALANGINRLSNIHVLTLYYKMPINKHFKSITSEGVDKINTAILNMPKLEILHNNITSFESCGPAKNQANLDYDLYVEYRTSMYTDGDSSEIWDEGFIEFKNILQRYGGKLVQIGFYSYSSNYLESRGIFSMLSDEHYERMEGFIIKQLELCMNLPYLTFFFTSFRREESIKKNPSSKIINKIHNYNIILENITRNKFIMIHSILVYINNIQDRMLFNPLNILADLWIV